LLLKTHGYQAPEPDLQKSIKLIREMLYCKEPIYVTPTPPEFLPKDVKTGSSPAASDATDYTDVFLRHGPLSIEELRKMQKEWEKE
jgi:hypothetical protein